MMLALIKKIGYFYIDGFKSMTVGKVLWTIIIIKVIIMFLVLKIFFFPNKLNQNFDTKEEKSQHILENLTK